MQNEDYFHEAASERICHYFFVYQFKWKAERKKSVVVIEPCSTI